MDEKIFIAYFDVWDYSKKILQKFFGHGKNFKKFFENFLWFLVNLRGNFPDPQRVYGVEQDIIREPSRSSLQ